MANETDEALATEPELTASPEDATPALDGGGEGCEPAGDGTTARGDHATGEPSEADQGPSAEVLAEAAAAEQAAVARADEDSAAPDSAADSSAAPAEGPATEQELATEADSASEEEVASESDPASEEEVASESDPATEEGPGALLSDDELRRVICALLFASPEALSESRLAQLAEGAPKARVRAVLGALETELAEGSLPFELRKLAGGWRLMTAAEMSDVVARLFQSRKSERLSAAGLETLAVVAYRQPVTKADIEAIRGVQCGPMLRTLVDRGLVRVTGRAEVPGHPLEYGTTRDFLDRFGLGALEELPRDGELLG